MHFLRKRTSFGCGSALIAALIALSLTGCTVRPGPEALITTAAPAGSKLVKIFVATNRERENPDSNVFTAQKAQTLNFAEFTIAIPADHRQGHIELAGITGTGFVVVDQRALTAHELIDRVSRFSGGKRRQEVTVFVHGFNNNFQESLFRLAQVTADSGIESAQVLFSWPSLARPSGYVADKESVTYSRDYLAALLDKLAANSRVGHIRLAAHSMGAWLAVETLRELRLAGRHGTIRKLEVVLAAPDLDPEVFVQQLRVIGPLTPPMKILVAKDDRALRVAGFLANTPRRVGSADIDDPRVQHAVRLAKVQVIDISGLSSADGLGHDRFVYLAGLYPRLSQRPILSRAGVFLLDATGAVLTTPLGTDMIGAGAD